MELRIPLAVSQADKSGHVLHMNLYPNRAGRVRPALRRRLGAQGLLDGRYQNVALRLGNDLADAGGCGFLFEISGPVHGADENCSLRELLKNLAGSGQSIHHGHDEVEDDDARVELEGLGDSLLSISGVEEFGRLNVAEQLVQRGSHVQAVVSNQDPGRHAKPVGQVVLLQG